MSRAEEGDVLLNGLWKATPMTNAHHNDELPYRVHLVEENVCICVGQYWANSDDAEAKIVETVLNEACGDTFGYFEVWHGADCIATVHREAPALARVVKVGSRGDTNGQRYAHCG
jgi:hypothetical protein